MRRDDLGLPGSGGPRGVSWDEGPDGGRGSGREEDWDDPWGESPEVRDTPAEVDAVFRTLRRIAATYFVVFLLLVAAFPVLSRALDWWSEARLVGELSPGFLTAGIGLYVVFAVVGIAAATLSSAVESRMLGRAGVSAGDVDEDDGGQLPGEGPEEPDDDGGRILLDADVPPDSPFLDPDLDAEPGPDPELHPEIHSDLESGDEEAPR